MIRLVCLDLDHLKASIGHYSSDVDSFHDACGAARSSSRSPLGVEYAIRCFAGPICSVDTQIKQFNKASA